MAIQRYTMDVTSNYDDTTADVECSESPTGEWVDYDDYLAERDALAEQVVRLTAERDYWQEAFGSWTVGDKMAACEAARSGVAAVAKHRKETKSD